MRLRRQFHRLPVEEMLVVHERIGASGRGLGALRLRIGEGLLRLGDGVMVLGFPSLESYAREALGRSGRWAADVRGLARRIAGLPLLREAVVSGSISCSMAELVARVATPSDEASWIEDRSCAENDNSRNAAEGPGA